MTDLYRTIAELEVAESDGSDFRRIWLETTSDWVVLAPHGGGIEPGTSEIARAIAGENFSLYLFEGIKRSGNAILHITSTHFDDPPALHLLERSRHALTIHGCHARNSFVSLGGLDVVSRNRILEALRRSGVQADHEEGINNPGTDPRNLCNRTATGGGVQLEFSEGLRRKMFRGLSRSERMHATEILRTVVRAVRSSMLPDVGSTA
jgi:phage replication-related protein YjqB (UPF0714/DUF867 family)